VGTPVQLGVGVAGRPLVGDGIVITPPRAAYSRASTLRDQKIPAALVSTKYQRRDEQANIYSSPAAIFLTISIGSGGGI
jgi:hypothetical protein